MPGCASDNHTGIITLRAPMTHAQRQGLPQKGSPLTLSIGPRKILPSMVGNRRIDDTTGNTCSMNSLTYDLIDLQYATPDFFQGYAEPNRSVSSTPAAALYLTFGARPSFRGKNGYHAIVMCLPIWGNQPVSEYADYLEQIDRQETDPNKMVSLESLFHQTKAEHPQASIGYSTCVEVSNDSQTIDTVSLYVLIFPRGIRTTIPITRLQTYAKGAYELPFSVSLHSMTLERAPLREGQRMYQGDGVLWSKSGYLYITQVDPSAPEFQKRFEYFTLPPQRSGSSPDMHTSRYKCIPMDQFKGINGPFQDPFINSHIRPGETSLADVSRQQRERRAAQLTEEKGGLSPNQVEGVVAGGIALMVVGILAFTLMRRATSNTS